jgi:transglutaminase-like putative cysteine protease
MIFRVSADLNYDLKRSATFLFAIKCARAPGQKVLDESFYTDPPLEVRHFDSFCGMNRLTRVSARSCLLNVRYQADVDSRWTFVNSSSIEDGPLENVPPESIPFLLPSRYCQSDRFRSHAMDLFGHLRSHYAIAAGVNDWIFNHVTYRSETTNEQSSAIDTFEERVGVCRDFAHLGIAMCRAMSLPARYVSCYSHLLHPNDFHAIFEVLISGKWYAFDATRLAPPNGIVRIATGRDAADASTCNMFGSPQLTRIEIICNARDNNFSEGDRKSGTGAWTMEPWC